MKSDRSHHMVEVCVVCISVSSRVTPPELSLRVYHSLLFSISGYLLSVVDSFF